MTRSEMITWLEARGYHQTSEHIWGNRGAARGGRRYRFSGNAVECEVDQGFCQWKRIWRHPLAKMSVTAENKLHRAA